MAKIMIVDDDLSMIGLLTTLLELDGFHIVSEANASAVTTKIGAEKPDVVLMDVNLKDGNGIDLLKQIRANAMTQNLPVVMSSGLDMQYECMEAGASSFIQKPYAPSDLVDMIKEATTG